MGSDVPAEVDEPDCSEALMAGITGAAVRRIIEVFGFALDFGARTVGLGSRERSASS